MKILTPGSPHAWAAPCLVPCIVNAELNGVARMQAILFALSGPAGAFTDWHVDFGGSSAWYHMVSGRKVYVLAPPTPTNLAAFESWASSSKQVRACLKI